MIRESYVFDDNKYYKICERYNQTNKYEDIAKDLLHETGLIQSDEYTRTDSFSLWRSEALVKMVLL